MIDNIFRALLVVTDLAVNVMNIIILGACTLFVMIFGYHAVILSRKSLGANVDTRNQQQTECSFCRQMANK